MTSMKQLEVWFATGSQHLYGPETLEQVAKDSREIVKALDAVPNARNPSMVMLSANTWSSSARRASSRIWWRSAAAINQVTFTPESGAFVAGSVITCYGLN